VTQGVDPEFKPQYRKKKRKKEKWAVCSCAVPLGPVLFCFIRHQSGVIVTAITTEHVGVWATRVWAPCICLGLQVLLHLTRQCSWDSVFGLLFPCITTLFLQLCGSHTIDPALLSMVHINKMKFPERNRLCNSIVTGI
jgi:hypothetical protein